MEETYKEMMLERTQLSKSASVEAASNGLQNKRLPSKKEYDSKCGNVNVYHLGKPMTWEKYLTMDDDIKRKYLNMLWDKHCGRKKDVANMFRINESVLTGELSRLGVNKRDEYMKKSKRTRKELAVWDKFVKGWDFGTSKDDDKYSIQSVMNLDSKEDAKKEEEKEASSIPNGYIMVKEPKSERMQLLIRPSVKADLKEFANAKGVSFNDLANTIFEEYMNKAAGFENTVVDNPKVENKEEKKSALTFKLNCGEITNIFSYEFLKEVVSLLEGKIPDNAKITVKWEMV